jgi:hypothetical protein
LTLRELIVDSKGGELMSEPIKSMPPNDAYKRNWDRIFLYNERAAIEEFVGNMSREEAEREARLEILRPQEDDL